MTNNIRPVSAGRWRARRVAQVRRWIERYRHPRLALAVIAMLTGVAALAASAALLAGGLTAMGLRYPLAVAMAYAVFVLLLWLWLRREQPDGDVPDASGSGNGSSPEVYSGGGGRFGGGGASGEYGPGSITAEAGEAAGSAANEAPAKAVEFVGDAAGEAGVAVVLLGLVVAAVALLGWWLLSLAPALAAELVIDALLAAVLYRRLRRHSGPYLLHAIVRRTGRAFLLLAVGAAVLGAWAQWQVPQVRTVGDLWSQFRQAD